MGLWRDIKMSSSIFDMIRFESSVCIPKVVCKSIGICLAFWPLRKVAINFRDVLTSGSVELCFTINTKG